MLTNRRQTDPEDLYLKEKNFAEALRHSSLSLDLGKEDGASDILAESLLLKSHLLLHEEAQRLDIYETIIAQMGLVRNPVILFKILANLYLYSRGLAEHIESADRYLKLLNGLKEVISPKIYQRLYRTYVRERVPARRLQPRAEGKEGRAAGPM